MLIYLFIIDQYWDRWAHAAHPIDDFCLLTFLGCLGSDHPDTEQVSRELLSFFFRSEYAVHGEICRI